MVRTFDGVEGAEEGEEVGCVVPHHRWFDHPGAFQTAGLVGLVGKVFINYYNIVNGG